MWKEKLEKKEPKRGAMFLNLPTELATWLRDMGEQFGVPASRIAITIMQDAMDEDAKGPKKAPQKPVPRGKKTRSSLVQQAHRLSGSA